MPHGMLDSFFKIFDMKRTEPMDDETFTHDPCDECPDATLMCDMCRITTQDRLIEDQQDTIEDLVRAIRDDEAGK